MLTKISYRKSYHKNWIFARLSVWKSVAETLFTKELICDKMNFRSDP